ncbi:hypothetical protein ACEWY4_006362 [Coilia grayii]|uniref:FIIND domain-containing protein n=1 Tax=Coilia grayii TaxID=363190 RepID=A0ABD1KDE1_9TELE
MHGFDSSKASGRRGKFFRSLRPPSLVSPASSETASPAHSAEEDEPTEMANEISSGPDPPLSPDTVLQYRLRCFHAGRYRFSETDIVFVVDGEGEVQYSITAWDDGIVGHTGLVVAGPLYHFKCTDRSLRQLLLPHCEGSCNSNLSVAHISSGNLEILQPLAVTDSHVTVNVTGLSLFGLLKRWLFQPAIRAQVLLFLQKMGKEH